MTVAKTRPVLTTVRYGLLSKILVLLLSTYCTMWSLLLLGGLLGLMPDMLYKLDTRNALSYTPVYARLAVFVWTGLTWVAAWRIWNDQQRAAQFMGAAIAAHFVIFFGLSGNPYYSGQAGYPNLTLEFLTLFLCVRTQLRFR
ncbi:hypothetical protein [Maricaulis sp. CAU 1757]